MGDKNFPMPWGLSPHSAYGDLDICCAGVNGEAGKGGWFMSLSHGLDRNDPQEMFDDFERHAALIVKAVNHHEELVTALELVDSGHEYKTPAGTINCRFCDHNMDHEGTYEDRHAADCLIHGIRAVLEKVRASDA